MNVAEYNKLIGQNIRNERIRAGRSQAELGKILNVTFQQMQKYETGKNRTSAASLKIIAEYLNQPLSAFYGENNKMFPDVLPVNVSKKHLKLINDILLMEDVDTFSAIVNLIKNLKNKDAK